MPTGQVPIEPGCIEKIAPGAFRRLAGEKRVREQIAQERGLDLPALAPGAVSVVDMAGVALAPKVKQGIGRAGVKADGVLAIHSPKANIDAAAVARALVEVKRPMGKPLLV